MNRHVIFARTLAMTLLLLTAGRDVAASPGAGVPVPDSCVGDACPDLRPVLNPPFPMAPNGLFFPQPAVEARPVRLASASVGPGFRPGPQVGGRTMVVPVQQRAPAPAPAQQREAPRPASGAAAPAQPDTRGVDSWFADCPPGQTTGCRIIRRAPGADGSPGVTLIVGPDMRMPGRNQATVILPLGIAVRESLPMLLDERFIALVPIETCLPAGCVLTVALPPPMVSVLRTATTLKFLALTPNGQTVPFTVPVGGFSDAYQKVAG